MEKILHPANTRGKANYGWLEANYSFSFANYYNPNRLQFGPLRVLNDDAISPSMGFGRHPHHNMEIITIPQAGVLKHKDSMGNEGLVKSGEIQIMSAGTGIEHSEINASATEELKLFQIWVIPEEIDVTPRYDQKSIADLLSKNELRQIIKPRQEAGKDDLWIHQQAYFYLGEFDEIRDIDFTFNNKNHGAYIFVIYGTVIVDNNKLNERDAMGIWQTDSVKIEIKANSKLLVIEVPINLN